MVKYHLVIEKDTGNTWKKNQEEKLTVFWHFFEVSVCMLQKIRLCDVRNVINVDRLTMIVAGL
jgi:hypothetical protein